MSDSERILNMSQTLESLTFEAAEKFVKANAYWIEGKEEKLLNPTEYRCMDDRDMRQKDDAADRLPSFAVPGATFGMVLDCFTAAVSLAYEHGLELSEEALYRIAEKAMGGVMTYHTDMVHAHDESPCGGCGFCGALLKLLKDSAPDFSARIMSQLTLNEEMLKARGIKTSCYTGKHVARAVMIVEADHIGLPSTSPDGTHVYVVHDKVRMKGLEKIGRAFYPILSKAIPTLSEKEWLGRIKEKADENLGMVAKNLNADQLPFYVVSEENGELAVRPMTSSAPVEEEIAA